MNQDLQFLKGHGTGNDFVLVPDEAGAVQLGPSHVRLLCDRRFGIGADGLLRVVPTRLVPEAAHLTTLAEWFMDYRNSDGSFAEMCGNGIRVFARYLVEAGLATKGEQQIATRGGIRTVIVPERGDISVDLGEWEAGTDAYVVTNGIRRSAVGIRLPNPHLVSFVDDLDEVGSLTAEPQVVDPVNAYPSGVNFEYLVRHDDRHVAMRVHERGSGETLSCGTGAGAVGVAAARQSGVEGDYRVDVPGGTLGVTVRGGTVQLRGPAEIVAEGRMRPGWDSVLSGGPGA